MLIPIFCRKRLFFIIFVLLALMSAGDAKADTLKSKYFTVYIHQDIDDYQLLNKLKVDYFLHFDLDKALPQGDDETDNYIRNALDAIYLEVCDILDIHMYSFSMDLEILPHKSDVGSVIEAYVQKKMDMPSFYNYGNNTIYISFEDLNVGMLSHEIAHAIISHYFAVAPPAKVQEVLAGYTEYSIRKMAHDDMNPGK